MSQYQKGKTNQDFTEAEDSEWQWHQLGHIRLHLAPEITMPAPHHSVFTGRMPFLLPNQQHQSIKGTAMLPLELLLLPAERHPAGRSD